MLLRMTQLLYHVLSNVAQQRWPTGLTEDSCKMSSSKTGERAYPGLFMYCREAKLMHQCHDWDSPVTVQIDATWNLPCF